MAREQYFYGHGKLLLTGEYFILDGALALALPTTVGQSLSVRYRLSYSPLLRWKSYDCNGRVWFEANFEFWHFNLVDTPSSKEALFLQKILRQARAQNSHFLRDGQDVSVEARLEFPQDWGLGSSSTLIYNIAQWAYVSPFELQFKTMEGSGFDIACAQSSGPILYRKTPSGPEWSLVHFDPPFKDDLYFIHLGRKQSTAQAIALYQERVNRLWSNETIRQIGRLTQNILVTTHLEEFAKALHQHEAMISSALDLVPIKASKFPDYPGEIKSLGAWGGDFVLATGLASGEMTKEYFTHKGYSTVIPYMELIQNSHLQLQAQTLQGKII